MTIVTFLFPANDEKVRRYCLTRPKPAYAQQGIAGGIVGPGYFSGVYILGCSQRLALLLQGSARITGSARFFVTDRQTDTFLLWK